MNRTALRHMMLHGDVVADEFNSILGYRTTHAALLAADVAPAQFSFTDAGYVDVATACESDPVTITGLAAAATITVTGGEYKVTAGGSWTDQPGTVNDGEAVYARHTSSASYATATNTVVTIGGVSDTYSSTTYSQYQAYAATSDIRMAATYLSNGEEGYTGNLVTDFTGSVISSSTAANATVSWTDGGGVANSTAGVYCGAFAAVPDIGTLISATLRLRCAAQSPTVDIAIEVQTSPFPAVIPSAGDNPYDSADFVRSLDAEHTFTNINNTTPENIDIADCFTNGLNDGLLDTATWAAVSKPATVNIWVLPDGPVTTSTNIGTGNNTTDAYKPRLTLVYIPA